MIIAMDTHQHGGSGGGRIHDLDVANVALYPTKLRPRSTEKLVQQAGLEPATVFRHPPPYQGGALAN